MICYEVYKKVLVARVKNKNKALKIMALLREDEEEVSLEELHEFTNSRIKELECEKK